MKVIIAGGRDFNDSILLKKNIDKLVPEWGIDEIVSGHAKGADTLGEIYANYSNIKLTLFPADWEQFGRRAGPIRNGQMADYADGLIAFWNGKSRGTKDMIDQATKKGLKVEVVMYDQGEENGYKET